MKSGRLLAAGMVVGFAAGLLAAPQLRPEDSADEAKRAILPRKSPRMVAADTDSTTNHHVRKIRAQEGQEPRVSIPAKEIAKVISTRLGDVTWFRDWPAAEIATYFPADFHDALTLLEASDSEIEEVRAIFQTLLKKLQTAESSDLKATQTSPSEIVVDFLETARAADQIFAETEEALRSAVPGGRGEALALAISSQSLYRYRKSDSFRLSVERDQSGELWLRMREASGGGHGSGLPKNLFPDNGTPIPADRILGARWHAAVSGMTLLPVNE